MKTTSSEGSRVVVGGGGLVGSVCELRRSCCSLGGHAAAIRRELEEHASAL